MTGFAKQGSGSNTSHQKKMAPLNLVTCLPTMRFSRRKRCRQCVADNTLPGNACTRCGEVREAYHRQVMKTDLKSGQQCISSSKSGQQCISLTRSGLYRAVLHMYHWQPLMSSREASERRYMALVDDMALVGTPTSSAMHSRTTGCTRQHMNP
jgi:hypothetical protein